jgi:hypothetical protein
VRNIPAEPFGMQDWGGQRKAPERAIASSTSRQMSEKRRAGRGIERVPPKIDKPSTGL